MVAGIFAFVVLRGLTAGLDVTRIRSAALRVPDSSTLFGVQSCINMAVNLRLMPAKGMTLPFISYGGSSVISLALGMGFLIAVTRKRPRAALTDDAVPEGGHAVTSDRTGTGRFSWPRAARVDISFRPKRSRGHAPGSGGLAVELMTDSAGASPSTAIDSPARACPCCSRPPHRRAGSVLAKAKAGVQPWQSRRAQGLSPSFAASGQATGGGRVRRLSDGAAPGGRRRAWRGVPVLLHEQNAVLGRANRFVASRAAALATGFPTLGKASDAIRAKATYTGNPVRPAVFAAAAETFPAYEDQGGPLNLLVTGGSQGARIMADVVPAAIEELDPETRRRLVVVQQARGEDERRVREAYARLGVAAEVAPFFADLPARMAAAHLVIARAGASTVSELATVGRASILVPFPHALDQDQAANAAVLAENGSAIVCPQSAFTPDWLAVELIRVLSMPADLFRRAQAARSSARWDSTERLADLVLAVAGHCSSEGQRS